MMLGDYDDCETPVDLLLAKAAILCNMAAGCNLAAESFEQRAMTQRATAADLLRQAAEHKVAANRLKFL